jgi:hypothetical protein
VAVTSCPLFSPDPPTVFSEENSLEREARESEALPIIARLVSLLQEVTALKNMIVLKKILIIGSAGRML